MGSNIQYSYHAREVILSLPDIKNILRRFVARHERDHITRNLMTPEGTKNLSMSFHRIITKTGLENVILIQLGHQNYTMCTEWELMDILKNGIPAPPKQDAEV